MAFNSENKVSWEEFAPSAQELFKGLQTAITKERNERISDINSLRNDLNNEIRDRKQAITDLNRDLTTYINTAVNNEIRDRKSEITRVEGLIRTEATTRGNEDDNIWEEIRKLRQEIENKLIGIVNLNSRYSIYVVGGGTKVHIKELQHIIQ